jgi:tetratricopeptide (TPR) repeat protein
VRAAKELVDRGFQPAQIRKALDQVKNKLPSMDRPLEKLRVTWDGTTLTLVDEGIAYAPTGQRLFDFALSDLADQAAQVVALDMAHSDGSSEGQSDAYEWFARGLSADEEKGDLVLAVACYRKALACDPGLAAAHANLGGLAYRSGDWVTARTEFETALSLDPGQPEARYNLARILQEQGENELAAAELRRVVEEAPWFADAHFNLASALEHLGSKRQAATHLRRFLELNSNSNAESQSWLEEARRRLVRLENKTQTE